jgi:hypothetical protein
VSVVVTNPDGGSALSEAFTVARRRDAAVWVDIVGRSAVRSTLPDTFTVLVGNRGNADAYGVPVLISRHPQSCGGQTGLSICFAAGGERDSADSIPTRYPGHQTPTEQYFS